MKSPIYDNQKNNNLSYSTVNDSKYYKNYYEQSTYSMPNSPYRFYKNSEKQEINQSRENYKKEKSQLRNTISVFQKIQDNKNKNNVDKILRNTSYISENEQKNNKKEQSNLQYMDSKQILPPKYAAKISKDGKQYFIIQKQQYIKTQKVLSQIEKRQKNINQLLKISKQSDKQYIDQLNNQKYMTKKYQQHNSSKISLRGNKNNNLLSYKPQISNSAQFLNHSSSYLRQKLQLKKIQRKQKEEIKIYKNKNPEENLLGNEGFRKIKNSYYTPKQIKTQSQIIIQSRYTPKLNIHKTYSNNYQQNSGQDNQIFLQNKSWNFSNSYSTFRSQQYDKIKHKQGIQQKQAYISPRARPIRKPKEQTTLKYNHQYSNNKITLISDFNLQNILGQGKFGKVYRAVHKATNFIFAIKKINKNMIQKNLMKDQLIQQIKIQYFCNHPNILKLYGFFDDSEHIYLILQYLQQGTLFKQLKKNKILSEKQASIKIRQVASGMTYLHDNGIIHRDIKPQNIVITNGYAKLCDFGWAAICKDRRKTYCGTFDYAAPQILQGTQYDMSVDLWCLGILAYELLVGKAPFYHYSRKQTIKKIMNVEKTAIQYPSHLSKNAISFIQSLLRKNPMERMTGQNILNHPFLPSMLDNNL